MNRLLELFFRRSLIVRILLVSSILLLMSLGIVGVSLYHLKVTESDLKNRRGSDLPSLESSRIFPPIAQEFLIGFENFGSWPGLHMDKTEYEFHVASLSSSEISHVEELLDSQARLSWQDLLELAAHPVHPPFPPLWAYMDVTTFLMDYLALRKATQADYPFASRLSILLKYSQVQHMGNPTILSKLRELTITVIISRQLRKMCNKQLITPAEAGEILAALKTNDGCRPSFFEAIRQENSFEKGYFRLYRSSPFGCFILEKILGNPLEQYERHLQKFREPPTDRSQKVWAETQIAFGHFFVTQALKNFDSYWEDCYVGEAKRAVIKQTLAHLAGSAETFPDPFTSKPLLSKEINGSLRYYSTGPDEVDNGLATGSDDI